MISILRTGPSMVLKVAYENDPEKTIGYASNLSFSQNLGQRSIYTVDSPFPQEIAQGAGPSHITGSLVLFMPKGSDPIRAGLVTPSTNIEVKNGIPVQVLGKYLHWKFYDRFSKELAFSLNDCKVSSWSAQVSAKSVVKVTLSFEGTFYEQGTA